MQQKVTKLLLCMEFLPPFLAKSANPVNGLQLFLNCFNYVHLIGNVNIADVPACHKQVIQLGNTILPVCVRHLREADVHEGVHIDDPSLCGALVP